MDLLGPDSLENIKSTTFTPQANSYHAPSDSNTLNNHEENNSRIVALKYSLERNFMVDKTHNTPLHYAAKLGDLKLANNLLENGVFIMTINSDYNTPLHEAFIHDHEEIVDLILNFMEQSSNFLNLKNNQGLTHLHIASTRKDGKFVKNFIEAGANFKDVVNKDSPYYAGYTVLQFAVKFKSIEVIKILVHLYKISGYDKSILEVVEQQHMFRSFNIAMIEYQHSTATKFKYTDPNHLTAFQWACFKEDLGCVKNLLAKGEEWDTSVSRKALFCPLYTPLHFAVEVNKKEIVKLLTQYGADIEKRNGHYMTPLHLALYYENHKEKDTIVDHLYNILVNKKANLMDLNGLTYFHIAITRNDLTWVKKLVDNGEDVNSPILCNPRNFSFYMPLHFAVRYGHLEMAKLLIQQGALINGHEDRLGDTPLHVAFEVGHIGLVDLLLKNGASVTAKRLLDGKTALHLLVDLYLNLDESDIKKDSILNYVGILVNSGCDINAKDLEENTALQIACCKFAIGAKCAQVLIAQGADVNLEDELEQTPLMCTFYFEYQDNGDDYLRLYHHVQNLKAINKEINPKNVRFCEILMEERDKWDKHDRYNKEAMLTRDQQRISETESMKKWMLTEDLSLYDYMKLPVDTASSYMSNFILKQTVMNKPELCRCYPIFNYLIWMQYRKALVHSKMTSKTI